MGTIYKATCPCGFEQFKLLQGHGMGGGQTSSFEIFQCDECHTLANYELNHEVDSLFEPVPCPDCKGSLMRLGGQPDQQTHFCPECHELTLVMAIIRLWD